MSESADDGAAGVGDRPGTEVAADDPEAGAIAFVTTEHFTLHGARSQTISESTGRASIFLASVSGGLIALGLVATATHVGTAFYVFGLILLPTLAFVGLVIFNAFCRPESRIAATRSGSPASAATTSTTRRS